MQEAIFAAALLVVSLTSTVATSAVREIELPINCPGDVCPEEQCWTVTSSNPFEQSASWSAALSAPDATNIRVDQPNSTDVLTENPGHYALAWSGRRWRCGENDASLHLCLSSATLDATPRLSITYTTDETDCDSVNGSTGDAASSSVPQFVVITWDDAFTQDAFKQHIYDLIHSNLDVRDSCGGYPRHTFFVSNDNTDYAALSHVLNFGAEYALHTVAHEDVEPTKHYWRRQIQAGRRWAERLVPSVAYLPFRLERERVDTGLAEKEEWRPVGFRAPWLKHGDALYEALQEDDGVFYDSSIPSYERPIWPYPLENGAHEGCLVNQESEGCPEPGRFHGVWEFPLNPLISEQNEVFLFDPPGTPIEIWRLLKHHLQHSFSGDRAPMMISLHSQQFFSTDAEQKKQILRSFFLSIQHEYASRGKRVVFATMRDILKWIQAGRPLDHEELCSWFAIPCAEHAPSPDHEERCDGWDNDGDGRVDEHVVNQCRYPQETAVLGAEAVKKLRTCAACPFEYPTDDGPDSADDGRRLTWKGTPAAVAPFSYTCSLGRIRSAFEFFEDSDGRRRFKAALHLQNPLARPSQKWYLRLQTDHIDVHSCYGVASTDLPTDTFLPAVLKFESPTENDVLSGSAPPDEIEIAGEIESDHADACIDGETQSLRDPCWKPSLYFTQDPVSTI